MANELVIDCSEPVLGVGQDGEPVVISQPAEPIVQEMAPRPLEDVKANLNQIVLIQRAQHLAAGFDYDFGDERGVHTIGTSDADMLGWDEVSKGATAAVLASQFDAPIAIVTDTGPAIVTALEWQHVLIAATAFRQPIWAASFALQSAIAAANDHEELASIDFEAAWP